jgi:YHS domain-containing protein
VKYVGSGVLFASSTAGEEHALFSPRSNRMTTMTLAKDSVCGMNVDTTKEHATSRHLGQTYHFCSDTCKDKFDQSPALYAARKTAD